MKKNAFSKQAVAGFTVIEMLLVLLIVGILSAIAGPSWVSFNNRQKANAVNEAVLRALQEGQQQAKTKKLGYSVSFKTETDVPKVAIHPATDTNPTNWQILANEVEVKSGKVLLGTNLTDENTAGTSITYASPSDKQTITFDHMGKLPLEPKPNLGTKGLIVTVAIPKPGVPTQPLDKSRRCVKVMTLLGAMQTAKEDECKAS